MAPEAFTDYGRKMAAMNYDNKLEEFCMYYGYQSGVDFMTMKPLYRILRGKHMGNGIAISNERAFNEFMLKNIAEAVI